jgi:vancomycin resistance protein YoaR
MSATAPAQRDAFPARPLGRPLPPSAYGAARLLWRAFAVAVLFVVAGGLGLVLYGQSHAGRVYQGVSVGGVQVGGMAEAAAAAAIDRAWRDWAAAPLTLNAGDDEFALVPATAGIDLDLQATVQQVMLAGREGSAWEQSRAWGRGLIGGIQLPLVVRVDPAAAPVALNAAAPGVARPPLDARVAMDAAGAPDLVPDADGVAIDARTTLAAVADRARSLSSAPVAIATAPVPAAVAADDLAPALAAARGAVDAPLVISGAGSTWHVPTAGLARLVAVDPSSGDLVADRQGLALLVDNLAAQIDRPVADADVVVEDGLLTAVPAVVGQEVDAAASIDRMQAALLDGADEVALVVRETQPRINDAAAERAAARGETMLNGGMTLRWDGGNATLERGDLLRALTIRIDPDAKEPFKFGLDEVVLAETLTPVAAEFDRPVRDAAFRLVNGRITVAADGADGRALDLDRGIAAIRAAFGSKPGPAATLPVTVTEPRWTARDAPSIRLGSDILGEGATWYGDSSDARRQNIDVASSKLGGWLVPPGGEFSYVDRIGAVDEASGFVTGLGIIEQDGTFVTAPVVGGGICQVSTTLYQAAFWSGLPITERYQHPYYLRTYGEGVTGLPGLDAMVNIDPVWSLDMRFANTTGNWLLVELFVDGENVWSRIVGTDPGWDIEVAEPEITNRTTADPKMHFTDSPELPAGTDRVVETAADGFDVSVTRTVRKGSKTVDVYTVSSSFIASRNLTLRGVGPTA